MRERDIQRVICDYLALKKYFFWRANTTSIYDQKRQVFRAMPKYAMRGVPDIIIVREGRFIGLEVKQEKGRQSTGQLQFQLGVTKVGGSYHVVRSLDDVRSLRL